MNKLIVQVAAVLALAGCATIDMHTAPPRDWPLLTVQEHRVSFGAVFARCYKYVPLGMKLLGSVPLACAEIDFVQQRCDVWMTQSTDADIREHELLHCAGHDHAGDATLRDLWSVYRSGVYGSALAETVAGPL
jgi:hypothetical protein